MKKFLIKLANCEIIQADKILHFSLTFILAAIYCAILKSMFHVEPSNLGIVLFSFLIAIIKEIFDKYFKGGHFCWWDILSGMLGAFFFILVIQYI